ncbi:MAG: V-type ATP synthase subunit I [Rikenellaceae bacterium]|nr:V-type ATP synthase subunit I [Rikenellaceae bacterium]
MIRYDIVLYAGQQEHFVNELRELGLVDITTTGWEPNESDRVLLSQIESYNKAYEFLSSFASSEQYNANAMAYASGAEAFECYESARTERQRIAQEVTRLEKLAEEVAPWGSYSMADIARLSERGLSLRFFMSQTATFERIVEELAEGLTIAEIGRTQSNVYFAVIATDNTPVVIDGQEVRLPQLDSEAMHKEIARLKAESKALDEIFSRAALSKELIAAECGTLKEQLQGLKVGAMAQREADGHLLILEGWAEADTADRVDALLKEYPNLVYERRDATIDDVAPVKLKNNKFARLFELIGSMYALPKYGTLDLTAIFGPFYMLFFAICLNDAGYGAVLLALGIILLKKGGPKLRQAAWLSIVCATATVLFGTYTGSLFGMSIPELLGYEAGEPTPFLDFPNQFFSIALAIGVVQILIGMAINIYMQTRLFGFTSTFGLLGWFIIILSGSIAIGLPMFGLSIPGFDASSPLFYACLGVGAVLMLLLNNVKRNPLINLGAGLWDAYNNITGLLSDVLSYIRLFAIGLSGGVLAQVFNSLAMGLSGLSEGIGDSAWYVVVVQIIAASAILIIGHGINLFMSAISSFVHPMRLTFVEFYKNAGFEMGQRTFDPVRKMNE